MVSVKDIFVKLDLQKKIIMGGDLDESIRVHSEIHEFLMRDVDLFSHDEISLINERVRSNSRLIQHGVIGALSAVRKRRMALGALNLVSHYDEHGRNNIKRIGSLESFSKIV